MRIWYIDPENGSDAADGRSEATPRKNWKSISVEPGDTVLFRRGITYRGSIHSPDGTPDAPVVWGAYGEGENPVICGSVNFSIADRWRQVSENVWEAVGLPYDEVCNIIFDGGASFGTLRWTEEELCEPGDWYFSHYGLHAGNGFDNPLPGGKEMYLRVYAPANPAEYWRDVEIAIFGDRRMAMAEHDVVFQDLTFLNGGVHGVACMEAERISVLRCRFENIGGCVWSGDLRIRYGNAVEFWRRAYDIRVEDCVFHQIYDSCVTHQGNGEYPVPERITFRNNTFSCYGMAAYEIRDVIPRDTVFVGNRCTEGGTGFAMQGEILPRRSEIWPQPMGHHLFVWRIEKATPGGSILIGDNYFGSVPCGSAEYSIIAPEAEAQIIFENNTFETGRGKEAIYRCGAYSAAEGDR